MARQHRGLARLSRLVAFAAIGLTLLVAARLTFVDGLLRHVTVDGPSMAPALCGARYMVTCGDCGFVFPCDAEHLPADIAPPVPTAALATIRSTPPAACPRSRVLIDRWPLLWRLRAAVM